MPPRGSTVQNRNGVPIDVKIQRMLYRSNSDADNKPKGYALFECIPLNSPDEFIYVELAKNGSGLTAGDYVRFTDCVRDTNEPLLYHCTSVDRSYHSELGSAYSSQHLRYVLEKAQISGISDAATINQVVTSMGPNAVNLMGHEENLITNLGMDLQHAKHATGEWLEIEHFARSMLKLHKLKIPAYACYGAWIYAMHQALHELEVPAEEDSIASVVLDQRLRVEKACEIIDRLVENPFLLVDQARCMKFTEVDRLQLMEKTDPRRIRSLVLSIFRQTNNTFLRPQTIYHDSKVEEMAQDLIQDEINRMVEEQILLRQRYYDETVYSLKALGDAERYIANKLLAMRDVSSEPLQITEHLNERIHLGDLYDEQQDAVMKILQNRVSLLTGGAGTGKTHVVKKIVWALQELGFSHIALAAPTGRAKERLQTSLAGTELKAKTLHSLLDIRNDEQQSKYNEQRPLGADVMIVDESSMISTRMMYQLLRALKVTCRLILVGDWHQLQPVEAGAPFRDICLSHCIAQARLLENRRTGEGTGIVNFANMILNNRMPDLSCFSSDIQLVECDNDEQARDKLLDVLDGLGAAENQSIVLSSRRDGPIGCKKLNALLQQRYSYGEPLLFRSREGVSFYKQDRVMATKNKYKDGSRPVYNGQLGQITEYEAQNDIELDFGQMVHSDIPQNVYSVTVIFDRSNIEMKYAVNQIGVEEGQLDLAYTMTVHKSQGSDFDTVIFMAGANIGDSFLDRLMLYTAVTRAKKKLILIGMPDKIRRAIEWKNVSQDWLRYRLTKELQDMDKQKGAR